MSVEDKFKEKKRELDEIKNLLFFLLRFFHSFIMII